MNTVITKNDLDADDREAFYVIERSEEAACSRAYIYAIGITILFILLFTIIFVVFIYIFRRTFKREIQYIRKTTRKLMWKGRKAPANVGKDERQFDKKKRKSVTKADKPTTDDTKMPLMHNAKPSIAHTNKPNSSTSCSSQQRPTATGTVPQSSAGAGSDARKRKSNSGTLVMNVVLE